jgi:hypothetical protein
MNFDVLSLDGVCMRPVAATGPGEVDRETLFVNYCGFPTDVSG